MASVKTYTWVSVPGKTLWHIARDFLPQSTYSQTFQLVQAIKNLNPSIDDWTNVPPGTPIYIPLK